jgi:hypothetical protein
MNRFVVLAIALALSPATWGQLYKYTDKDGKTVYTDQPPGNVDSKALKAPPPPPASGTKSPTPEKDKAAPKAPRQAAEAKKPERTLTVAEREERCQAARENYAIYFDRPVMMRNTVTGERTQLDDKQADADMAKAKVAMEAACKKPPE